MKISERNNIKLGKGKEFTGKIISVKNAKTVIVEVIQMSRHILYKKLMKKSKHFAAHTDKEYLLGDIVRIKEVRPISKLKHFIVKNKVVI
jgi:small subunit ribosomal protein S17